MAAAAQAAGGNVNAFADQHFKQYGEAERRDFFDANAYLQENPDVFAAGANPFEHYYPVRPEVRPRCADERRG